MKCNCISKTFVKISESLYSTDNEKKEEANLLIKQGRKSGALDAKYLTNVKISTKAAVKMLMHGIWHFSFFSCVMVRCCSTSLTRLANLNNFRFSAKRC